MGQPAARLGDATAHGGVLTQGNPTVLINGRPAAALGDLHVCPMCAPGPHVGGPVLAGAPTVLIGGKPAARVGDLCACTAPAPDAILSGSPNVLIGGASPATTPGLAAVLASAHGASLAPGTPGTGTSARPLSPYVGVGYTDKAGRAVAGWHYAAEATGAERRGQVGSGGQVWVDALAESGTVSVGLVGVAACRWAKDEARVGEAVGMSARCAGLDGTAAVFTVWRETVAADGQAERLQVFESTGTVSGGEVCAGVPFTFEVRPGGLEESAQVDRRGAAAALPSEPPAAPEPPGEPSQTVALADTPLDPYGDARAAAALDASLLASTSFTVTVSVDGRYRGTSAPLRFQDWIPVRTRTPDGQPIAGAEFELVTSAGEVRRGTTGSDGTARVEAVPPGPYQISLVKVPSAS